MPNGRQKISLCCGTVLTELDFLWFFVSFFLENIQCFAPTKHNNLCIYILNCFRICRHFHSSMTLVKFRLSKYNLFVTSVTTQTCRMLGSWDPGSLFTESAHWADSVIESRCPSVCVFVPCEEDLSFYWRGLLHIPQIWGGVCVCVRGGVGVMCHVSYVTCHVSHF